MLPCYSSLNWALCSWFKSVPPVLAITSVFKFAERRKRGMGKANLGSCTFQFSVTVLGYRESGKCKSLFGQPRAHWTLSFILCNEGSMDIGEHKPSPS